MKHLYNYLIIPIVILFGISFVGAQCTPMTNTVTVIHNNEVYCLSSEITVSNLKIEAGGKLIIETGALLNSNGAIILLGELIIEDNAGVNNQGALDLGSYGNQQNALLRIGNGSYFTIKGSFTLSDPSFGGFYPGYEAVVEMGTGSVLEICSTFQQVANTYPAIKYIGDPGKDAYLITKSQAAGTNYPLIEGEEIVWTAMHSVTTMDEGNARYCGPFATSATCPGLWPTGLGNDYSQCDEAQGIIDNYDFGSVEVLYARPDIHQAFYNETVLSGNVLTNDYGDGLEVDGFTYINSAGQTVTGSLNTPTDIYVIGDDGLEKAGELTMNEDGSYTFEPEDGFFGEVSISYIAIDGDENTDSAELTFKVIPPVDKINNNRPIANNDTYTVKEDETAEINVLANDSDPDGDTLEVDKAFGYDENGDPTQLSTDDQNTTTVYGRDGEEAGEAYLDNNGNIIFKAKEGYEGEVNFEYNVIDGAGEEDTGKVTVNVVSESDYRGLYVNDDAIAATAGSIMTGNVSDNDDWGDTQKNPKVTEAYIYIPGSNIPLIIGQEEDIPGVGKITVESDGSYTFVSDPDYTGTLSLIYTVENDDGTSDSATLYLTALDEFLLLVTPDINQTPQGETVTGNVLTNDIGDNLKVDSFTYTDETGTEVTGSLNTPTDIYVIGDNGPEKAGKLTMNEDGSYTFEPEEDFTGDVNIGYTAKNANGNEGSSNLTIKTIPELHSSSSNNPIAQNDTYLAENGTEAVVNILANDTTSDGGSLNLSGVTGLDSSGNSISISGNQGAPTTVYDKDNNEAGTAYIDGNGNIVFNAKPGYSGDVTFNYTVDNGNGGTDSATAFIKVVPENTLDGSVFTNDDSNAGADGEKLEGSVSENDYWGGTDSEITTITVTVAGVTVSVTPGISEEITGVGEIQINADGSYEFIPEEDFVGTVNVVYTVENLEGDSSTSTLYLTTLGSDKIGCPKPANTTDNASGSLIGLTTKVSTLNAVNDWPGQVPNGYLVMDSDKLGFVINHMTTTQRDALSPVEGMLIYNTTEECVQMYRGAAPSSDSSRTGWNCLAQSCN